MPDEEKKPGSNDKMSLERYCKMLQGILDAFAEAERIAQTKKETDEVLEKWSKSIKESEEEEERKRKRMKQ